MKKYLSLFLRKIGLIGLADRLNFRYQLLKNKTANKRFQQAHPNIIFPPPYFIFETYRLDYEQYYKDGLETATEIIDQTRSYLPASGLTVLDWGCGPGRITRHLPTLLPAGSIIYGADYNKAYTDWCNANLEGIKFIHTGLLPPLPLADASIDLAISISVITHLSTESINAWIKELDRVMKKNGVLYLTSQGNSFANKLSPAEKDAFEKGKVVTRGLVKEGHRLFSTFHPEHNLAELFAPYFNVLEHHQGKSNSESVQDCWILQKKISLSTKHVFPLSNS